MSCKPHCPASPIVTGIQQLIRRIVDDLNGLQNADLRNNEIAVPILEHCYAVIEDVKGKVGNLLNDVAFLDFMAAKAESVGPGMASGGILAVVGGMIAALTVVILDILDCIFLGLGVIWAGGVLNTKRRAMIQKIDRELDRNRDHFRASITEQLQGKLGIVYEETDRNLVDPYQYVGQQEASAVPLLEQFQSLIAQSQELSGQIEQL